MSDSSSGSTLGSLGWAFMFWGYLAVKLWGTAFLAWSYWWLLLPIVPWAWFAFVKFGGM